MNIVAANLGIDPDIWGTVIGMALCCWRLLVIPFLDRAEHEPEARAAAFDLRQRGWAFIAMGSSGLCCSLGVVQSALTEAG